MLQLPEPPSIIIISKQKGNAIGQQLGLHHRYKLNHIAINLEMNVFVTSFWQV